MTAPKPVVFLMDVDNTLLDNDKVAVDVKRFLDREVGRESQERYFAILEDIREQIGYSDYLASYSDTGSSTPTTRRSTPCRLSSSTTRLPTGCTRARSTCSSACAAGAGRPVLRRRRGVPAAEDRARGCAGSWTPC